MHSDLELGLNVLVIIYAASLDKCTQMKILSYFVERGSFVFRIDLFL